VKKRYSLRRGESPTPCGRASIALGKDEREAKSFDSQREGCLPLIREVSVGGDPTCTEGRNMVKGVTPQEVTT